MHSREPVLFVIDQFLNPYAGTESQLFKLLGELPSFGFEPRLLVMKSSAYTDSNLMPCPVDVLGHHRLSSPRTWWALWRYGRRLRQQGFRLAHVFFNDASLVCPPVLRVCGFQILISRRDMGYWYTPAIVLLLRLTRRWVSGVVVNSQAVGDVTAATEGHKRDLVYVIYNGYDNAKAAVDEPAPIPELKALSEMGPVAFLVANIRQIKRIEDALSAVAELGGRGHYLALAVIGDGSSETLRQHAEQLGIGQRVLFMGSRSDVTRCLTYGTVGLSCSESEGYSNAVVEYMQAGLPVVASDVGGNREAVVNGKTGWRYPVGDVEALASRLESLLANPEKASLMGRAGKQLALERHGLENMIQAHARLYSKIIESDVRVSS
ncbi:glycosyltransferase [Marinobacter confluentis]|uniref:Glycosyltransferase n=1 Tax=Marinobacter confluentis TaxID=1697557 RepID=A0A4Z1C7B4_9GAMM|nr:glycosyltransferase [Marinobacter confluentis]TGN41520.1 glycosyltransferase [Marinobacter confluentis]